MDETCPLCTGGRGGGGGRRRFLTRQPRSYPARGRGPCGARRRRGAARGLRGARGGVLRGRARERCAERRGADRRRLALEARQQLLRPLVRARARAAARPIAEMSVAAPFGRNDHSGRYDHFGRNDEGGMPGRAAARAAGGRGTERGGRGGCAQARAAARDPSRAAPLPLPRPLRTAGHLLASSTASSFRRNPPLPHHIAARPLLPFPPHVFLPLRRVTPPLGRIGGRCVGVRARAPPAGRRACLGAALRRCSLGADQRGRHVRSTRARADVRRAVNSG
jgi:hypothetical protein